MSENTKKQAKCWMTGTTFEIGDIVTRGGHDRQKIIDINDVGDMIEVECIKEPLGWLNDDGSRGKPWCKLGDREWNLTRRYSFPEEMTIDAGWMPGSSHYELIKQSALAAIFGSLISQVEVVDAELEADQVKWAEIASLWQPNGGDA